MAAIKTPSQKKPSVAVVIPVLNEEKSLAQVLRRIPQKITTQVVVADNGSTDRSAAVARRRGAEVVREDRRGYGAACLKGLEHLAKRPPDIVVFLDGDFSCDPALIPRLLDPIRRGGADLVLGQRTAALRQEGAMPPQARFGNWLATALIRLLWDFRYSDLGPFRAVRWEALRKLGMRDRTWGWTVEMQVKAVQRGLRIAEVTVPYRRRFAGKSKISGTFSGTLRAGFKILSTIARLKF